MTGHYQESTALNEHATARAGLFATAAYFEPPRDLRRGIVSFLSGLGIYGTLVLGMALYG
jgi:hypothetical protein